MDFMFFEDLFVTYGPLALGWVVAFVVWREKRSEVQKLRGLIKIKDKAVRDTEEAFRNIQNEDKRKIRAEHRRTREALNDNTKVLAIIAERLRNIKES